MLSAITNKMNEKLIDTVCMSNTTTAQQALNGKKSKKKCEPLGPSIRFDLKLEKPSSDKFSKFNYNALVIKTLKFLNKKPNDPTNDKKKVTQQELDIVDGEFHLKKQDITDFLSIYERKIVLSKQFHQNTLLGDEDETLESDEETSSDEDTSSESSSSGESVANGDDVEVEGESESSSETSDDSDDEDDENDDENYDRKYRNCDFGHLGIGYDDDDSFIDNTEAVDEVLPTNMRPKHGGFYINKSAKVKLVESKGMEPCIVVPKLSSSSNKRKKKAKVKNKIRSDDDERESISGSDNEAVESKKKKLNISMDALEQKQERMQSQEQQEESNSKGSDDQIIHLKTVNNQALDVPTSTNEAPETKLIKLESFTKISNELRENLVKFEDMIANKKLGSGMWDENFKKFMLNLFKLQEKEQDKVDKNNLVIYMAQKVGIARGALRRRIHRYAENEKKEHNKQQQQIPLTKQQLSPPSITYPQSKPFIINESSKVQATLQVSTVTNESTNDSSLVEKLNAQAKDDIYRLINLARTRKINVDIKNKEDQEFFSKLSKIDNSIRREVPLANDRTRIYDYLNQIINVSHNNSQMHIQKLIKLSHILSLNKRVNEILVRFNNKLRELLSNGCNFEWTQELKMDFKAVVQQKLKAKSLELTPQQANDQVFIKDFIQTQIINVLPKLSNSQFLLNNLLSEANQIIMQLSVKHQPQNNPQTPSTIIPHSLNSILSTTPKQQKQQSKPILQSPSHLAKQQASTSYQQSSSNLTVPTTSSLATSITNDWTQNAFITAAYQTFVNGMIFPSTNATTSLNLPSNKSVKSNRRKHN